MRLASYLFTSRHGIFYFRFPLPPGLHPDRKRSHLKLSLGTRDPRRAATFARLLTVSGQSVLDAPILRAMRYDEIREHVRDHFTQMLQAFRERTAIDGPPDEHRTDILRTTLKLAETGSDEFLSITTPDDKDFFLRDFCAARGITKMPEGREKKLMSEEYFKGYREFLSRAIHYSSEFDTLPLEGRAAQSPTAVVTTANEAPSKGEALPLAEVVSRYFEELERTNALVAKTQSEKEDALALMAELTGTKPLADMTKGDAQKVKAALFKLPKNRRKNPKTRDLPLSEMLELPGVEHISARTMNVYLGHMQSLFTWAVNNGYAQDNIFTGLRVKAKGNNSNDGRIAFSAEQLQLMFNHLTDPSSPLVKKDIHKWPALIGMFTGMRLNEIAQLEVQDIEEAEGVWCINVTPDGNDKKRLKNSASRRRVPVHTRLIEAGLLAFHDAQKQAGHSRLFPTLTYSAQNGYGRNAGRWFNERFLTELELGGQGLVFHCLRHTMITRLLHAGVEAAQVKAIAGHSQTGVTFKNYFKEGYLPTQLRDAVNKFDF